MTMVDWSCATTCVFTVRFEVVGPSCGSFEAISSVCSSMWSRTFPPSLICGLILSRSSTGCRWIGATRLESPPRPRTEPRFAVAVVPVVPETRFVSPCGV